MLYEINNTSGEESGGPSADRVEDDGERDWPSADRVEYDSEGGGPSLDHVEDDGEREMGLLFGLQMFYCLSQK